MHRNAPSALIAIVVMSVALPSLASFPGTEVFLPSIGRGPGAAGSQWDTCVWVHNPGTAPADVQFRLLLRNQPNPAAQVFNDTIPPGDTRRYDNAVEAMFGEPAFGALRVTSSQKVLVGSRIYSLTDLASGDVMFAATGVTDGPMLSGVRFGKDVIETETVVMRSVTGTVRRVKAEHRQFEKFYLD